MRILTSFCEHILLHFVIYLRISAYFSVFCLFVFLFFLLILRIFMHFKRVLAYFCAYLHLFSLRTHFLCKLSFAKHFFAKEILGRRTFGLPEAAHFLPPGPGSQTGSNTFDAVARRRRSRAFPCTPRRGAPVGGPGLTSLGSAPCPARIEAGARVRTPTTVRTPATVRTPTTVCWRLTSFFLYRRVAVL